MAEPVAEFSRLVVVERLSSKESIERIQATEAERQALARRFDLPSINSLTAEIRLRRVKGGRLVRVAGTLHADVVQSCVVTLEPIPAQITDQFHAVYAPSAPARRAQTEIDIDPDAEEEPEPIHGGVIDIGELTAQHLSLALPPYPRVPGARFELIEDAESLERAEAQAYQSDDHDLDEP